MKSNRTVHRPAQPPPFPLLLEVAKMYFTLPEGFEYIATRTNRDLFYDYAIRSKTKKLEIRCRIIPITWRAEEPSTWNDRYLGVFLAFAGNIAGGVIPEALPYPEEGVRKEFGADAGLAASVDLHSEFGEGYAQCVISMIHKDDTADAFVFYLFDESEVIGEALTTYSIFHALQFF